MQISSSFYNANSEIYNKNSLNSKNEQNEQDSNSQKQMVNGVKLDAQELQTLRELQNTDRNVKAHEAAHQAAGGGLTGPASFSYTRGPDNQMYAVAGEVPIRMQKGNTPEESISIARKIMAAAMAPADPSPQDYKVAANAAKMELEARAEAAKIKAEEAQKSSKNNENSSENSNSSEVDSSKTSEGVKSNKTSEGASKNSNSSEGANFSESLKSFSNAKKDFTPNSSTQENLAANNEFKAFVANIYKQNSNSLKFNFTLNIAS